MSDHVPAPDAGVPVTEPTPTPGTAPDPTTAPATEPATAVTLRAPAHRVGRSAPWLWGVGAVARVVVLLAVGVAVELFGWYDVPGWAWVLYGVLAVAYVPLMPLVRYRIHRWESTETAVYTQTGFLSRERHIAPMSKVQTIDMDESPVARLFGLATVTVTTASAMGSLTITALDRAVAEQLVSDLTRRTEAEADDAT